MPNYKIILEYEGTKFVGWQQQENGNSIQGAVQDALFKLSGNKTNVFGAGRTDAGVHAIAQTANIKLPSKFSSIEIKQALNGNLKRDVRIDSVEEIETDFVNEYSKKYNLIIINEK